MSGSTAAAVAATPVTSNGASLTLDAKGKPDARRRTMVIVEKTLNADGLSAGGTNGVANGKDLSHTIRGESVIERPKDYSKLKKRLIASSTVSPRRKKAVPKPEKPKWQTVLSVLTKNCLLLAALLWLGQTVWRWSYSIGDNANSPFASLDYESRIYDVEASIKETAKMLQVQLDVVDKKIGSEIGIVTRELLKQAEEKGALFEEELKKLEAKTDSLDKSLGELKDKGLLSREEFEKLLNDLDDSNINLDLDQIRAFARDIVQKEIEKHAADGLGRVDYALASGGAKVVRHSEPYGFGKGNTWFAKGHNGVHANAHKMLEPSFGEPGQCFPLQGSSGFVELRLRTGIIPEAVTLEHVAKVRFFLFPTAHIYFSHKLRLWILVEQSNINLPITNNSWACMRVQHLPAMMTQCHNMSCFNSFFIYSHVGFHTAMTTIELLLCCFNSCFLPVCLEAWALHEIIR
ncbi:unnamed protein product [Musa hybrid cultivar]